MNDNRYLPQQNETYINDISDIVDAESFQNFLRIAYETNPVEIVFGLILIVVVGIYVNKKTSAFIKPHVRKYIEKRFVKRM